MEDWRAKYYELVRALRIHESHEHEQVLRYARQAKDEQYKAARIINAGESFRNSVREIQGY